MNTNSSTLSFLKGLAATFILLAVYFLVLTLVSGWQFAESQFGQFWYFIVSLALGFGIQFGLYVHLKYLIHHRDPSGKIVAVTGTTSTAAMISCCAHYLVNVLPILGATGIATIAAQYQIEFFWLGLALNVAGIVFIARRITKFNLKGQSINN